MKPFWWKYSDGLNQNLNPTFELNSSKRLLMLDVRLLSFTSFTRKHMVFKTKQLINLQVSNMFIDRQGFSFFNNIIYLLRWSWSFFYDTDQRNLRSPINVVFITSKDEGFRSDNAQNDFLRYGASACRHLQNNW